MSIKQELKKQIEEVLGDLGAGDVQVSIDVPADLKHGDYSSNAAFAALKNYELRTKNREQFRNPIELAVAMKMRLDALDIPFLSKIEVVPPGFLNFRVSESYMMLRLAKVVGETKSPVLRDTPFAKRGQKVVVEYSSPNIAKPFTIGHLRSTVIGDAIANLLEATGWDVKRDNHLGDWGTQFGKQIYALIHLGEGSLEKNLAKIENATRPVKELVDLYVEFHDKAGNDPTMEDKARDWFTKLENGDSQARELWQKCIDWSWKEFEAIYRTLGVMFTENNGRGYGEAFFEDKMDSIVKELEEKGLLKKGEEGAQLVFFENNKLPPLMILKKDGSTLYATRDLATDKFRLQQYGKDVLVVNEVGVEQSLYFQQLYKVEEMLGWFAKEQRVHVKHGHYRFKEGKMSTRKGNVVWLEEVLSEAEKRAEELGGLEGKEGLEIAKVVGIGAIKWNDLKRDSKQDIVFDWDDILNMQGNSGPYMQYTYARTQSVLARVKGEGERVKNFRSLTLNALPFTLAPEEREVLRLLIQFGDIVEEAAERFAPNILCTYLFELAQAFNLFYQKHTILKAEGETRHVRLALTEATGNVIKKGLSLLGIQAPQIM